MAIRFFLVVVLAVCAWDHMSETVPAQNYPKLSPYSAIRWKPEVQLDGQWHTLLSIDGVSVEEIVAFARRQYDSLWQKRFNEDLVQVLSEMGRPPGKTVTLVVRDLKTGQEKTLKNVPLTAENRRAIMGNQRLTPLADLKPDDLRQALDAFQTAVDERWSYRHAAGADFDMAIAVLRAKVDAGLSPSEFGIELQKIIALGIDGHAEVSGFELPPGGYLPFLVEPAGERFVAFQPDRTAFLADGFPYVTKIDGKALSAWRQAAAVLVPKGSPQYVRRHSLRVLRDLDLVRGLMELPRRATVEVELAARDGRQRRTLTLPVARRRPIYGVWPRGRSRRLEGEIGYLRLAAMDDAAIREIKTWMPAFRDTRGLIVDVRDNGGGSREPLQWLYSYLANADDPPRAFTAAAYRLHPEHREDHLAQRFMYRADAPQWTLSERQAVAAFARTFQPQRRLPQRQFSEWHYMTLNRLDDPVVYRYTQPVVVLMNAKCFSAADIFLAGLKGMKNVTLVGAPSAGGSALAQRVKLGGAPFELRIASIASFQADGKLFDGHGVQPDVEIEPEPEYYLGGPDNVLAEAVKRIAG
jgi:hypothetical protein